MNSWRKESQAEENRYLIWTADWGGEHNTSRHTEYRYYFLIHCNCNNASNFLSWRFLLYFWLQELIQKPINEQIVIFYSPSNAPCSSDKSIQIKYFKHHSSVVLCCPFTWFNLQVMKYELWRHIESKTGWTNVQMCYRKNRVLLWFTINSQLKLKKFSILIFRYLPRKTCYEI